jgi:phosphoesterase RecJ-like protein
LGKLLEKAESLFAGRLIVTTQTVREREEAGPNVRSSEELYSLFQTVKGVEAIAFLREESGGLVSVGLRSLKRIDVAAIAQAHGGGGHKLAAGFNYSGSLDAVKSIVIKEFEKYFPEEPARP